MTVGKATAESALFLDFKRGSHMLFLPRSHSVTASSRRSVQDVLVHARSLLSASVPGRLVLQHFHRFLCYCGFQE